MFVVLFRKSVNTALPLLSIPLIPEGNISGTEERKTDTISIFAFYSTFNPSPPLISSHSLNIFIFHLTPPPFRSVLTFFLLDYPPSSPSFTLSIHTFTSLSLWRTLFPLYNKSYTFLHLCIFMSSHHLYFSTICIFLCSFSIWTGRIVM